MTALGLALAASRAARGASTCPDVTPGDLAQRLDLTVEQRKHLQQIDAAFAKIDAGEVDRVVLAMPPQTGKSSRIVWAAFWWLAMHPKHAIVLASYGQGLADARGRAVRALVEQHGAEFGLFLDPRTTAANNWQLTTGGGMRCVGVGAGLTGFPADVAFVDDPVKDRVDAESPTMRETSHEWWSSTLVSRLAPGAPAVVLLTRWHPDDLAGRLLSDEGRVETGGRWLVVELPALAVDHPRNTDGVRTCACPDGAVHDALGRAPGEPLPHPKIPETDTAAAARHWADKRASSTTRDWHALYQADPQPMEGALVSVDLLRNRRHYDDVSPPTRVGVAIDPSGGGRDSCGIIGGHLGADGRLWLMHDRSGVMSSAEWGRAACLLAFDSGAVVFVFESNYGGDQPETILGLSWERLTQEGKVRGLMPRIKRVHARTNKVIRAEPVAQALVEDKVRLGAPLADLESEWSTYQTGSTSSPGRLDASVYLVNELLPTAGNVASVGVPRGTRSDAPPPRSTLTRTHLTRSRVGGTYDPMRGAAHLAVVRDPEAS